MLQHFLATMLDHAWLIMSIVLTCMLAIYGLYKARTMTAKQVKKDDIENRQIIY